VWVVWDDRDNFAIHIHGNTSLEIATVLAAGEIHRSSLTAALDWMCDISAL
jgi:hypothetical protein